MMDPFHLLFPGIHDDGRSSDSTTAPIERLTTEVRNLQRRADLSALVAQALWELLRENTSLTDSDLLRRVREIDLRDGVADGRMTATPTECPSCHRQSNSKRGECLYCGTPLPGRNILENL